MDNKLTRKERINAIWMGTTSLIASILFFVGSQFTNDAGGIEKTNNYNSDSIFRDDIGTYELLLQMGGGVAILFSIICFAVAIAGSNISRWY